MLFNKDKLDLTSQLAINDVLRQKNGKKQVTVHPLLANLVSCHNSQKYKTS